MPAALHIRQTAHVRDDPAGRSDRVWRLWAICLPAALAFIASVLFIVADAIAGVMGSWDTPVPNLWWIKFAIIGHCVLAVLALVLLAVGVHNSSWRRVAVIGAWMIIPVGFGWLLLIGRLVSAA
jgi:hypothetical protein